MLNFIAEHASVIAAGLSALAALLSAITAIFGPLAAARLAERLRQEASERDETRQAKLRVFSTLMQERAALDRAAVWSVDGVRALNLIDVAFHRSMPVREAWADLFRSFDRQQNVPQYAQVERLLKLLQEMALDLGLAGDLRTDDFKRIYFPEAMAQEQLRQYLERDESIRRLQGANVPGANAAPPLVAQQRWPPRPE